MAAECALPLHSKKPRCYEWTEYPHTARTTNRATWTLSLPVDSHPLNQTLSGASCACPATPTCTSRKPSSIARWLTGRVDHSLSNELPWSLDLMVMPHACRYRSTLMFAHREALHRRWDQGSLYRATFDSICTTC